MVATLADVQLFFEREDLEAHLSRAEMRALLDDNNDGEADFDPVENIRKNASSKVSSYLRPIYVLPLTIIPHEVIRLALECAEYMVCRRFPSVTEKDWKELKSGVEKDLMLLREGKVRLDVPTLPEPAANKGATLFVQTNDGDPPKKFFVGGMGDF